MTLSSGSISQFMPPLSRRANLTPKKLISVFRLFLIVLTYYFIPLLLSLFLSYSLSLPLYPPLFFKGDRNGVPGSYESPAGVVQAIRSNSTYRRCFWIVNLCKACSSAGTREYPCRTNGRAGRLRVHNPSTERRARLRHNLNLPPTLVDLGHHLRDIPDAKLVSLRLSNSLRILKKQRQKEIC